MVSMKTLNSYYWPYVLFKANGLYGSFLCLRLSGLFGIRKKRPSCKCRKKLLKNVLCYVYSNGNFELLFVLLVWEG